MRFVLDASALLALIQNEPGAERVSAALRSAALSSVNLSEVVTKLVAKGVDTDDLGGIIGGLDLTVHAHDYGLALDTGMLHAATRAFGLSLGDRACLALARELGATALTTDGAWKKIDVGIAVEIVR